MTRLLTRAGTALAAGVSGAAIVLGREVVEALGGRPAGGELERIRRSPQHEGGVFRNPSRARGGDPAALRDAMRRFVRDRAAQRPARAVPVVHDSAPPSETGVHVTWFGHSSVLLELDGRRVLVDPVWSRRASPSQAVGPRRVHPVPVEVEALPRLDAIVVSHDHYDHLDTQTVRRLTASQAAPFVVPLGVGAHLRRWGVPDARIVELDWHERADVAGVELTATPAQHFSGRGRAENTTLWASWVLRGPAGGRAFYTGDTGYFEGWRDLGAEHGPFDVTLVQVGAYDPAWPDVHMTPEEGVRTHLDLRGGVLVPVHWGTFVLAPHPWAEPAEGMLAAAAEHGVALAVPRPGERVDVAAVAAAARDGGDGFAPDPWWRACV